MVGTSEAPLRKRSEREVLAAIFARVPRTEAVVGGALDKELRAVRDRFLAEGDPDERDANERANRANRPGGSRGGSDTAFSEDDAFEWCERAIDAIYDERTHPWVTHSEVVNWLMQDPAARRDVDRWAAQKGGKMTSFRMASAAQGLFCKSWSVPTAHDPPAKYDASPEGEAYRPRRSRNIATSRSHKS